VGLASLSSNLGEHLASPRILLATIRRAETNWRQLR
jgi:hypothetical protein